MITCEYNLKPMNHESEKFHLSIGYQRVGKLNTQEGAKEVSLMVKNI
jgi:predicted GNAT superfamily acetyltransferase